MTDLWGACSGFIPGTRRVAVGAGPLPRTRPINLQYSVGGMKLAAHGFLTSVPSFLVSLERPLTCWILGVSVSKLHPPGRVSIGEKGRVTVSVREVSTTWRNARIGLGMLIWEENAVCQL